MTFLNPIKVLEVRDNNKCLCVFFSHIIIYIGCIKRMCKMCIQYNKFSCSSGKPLIIVCLLVYVETYRAQRHALQLTPPHSRWGGGGYCHIWAI